MSTPLELWTSEDAAAFLRCTVAEFDAHIRTLPEFPRGASLPRLAGLRWEARAIRQWVANGRAREHLLFDPAAGDGLPDRDAVLARATPAIKPGIYFLLAAGSVVYVGQSVNVIRRLGDHFGSKRFDSVAFVSCTPELLDATEAHYIATFDPPLNRQRPVAGR